jgi:hypothetical protein
VVVAVVIAWAVALPRLVPSTFGDHGTYASVAERLIAGDRLYVDVWDNKDPLFYYALALGRLVSPLADVALEILWVVGAGVAVLVLALSAGADRRLSVGAGLGAMWLRGELPGWVENFRLNADYADGGLASSQYGSVVGHLLRAFPEDGRGAGMLTVAALIVVLVAIPRSWRPATSDGEASGPTAHRAATPDPARERTIGPAVLWDLVLVSLVLGLVVMSATATWPHHALTLAVPAGFALALVAARWSRAIEPRRAAALILLAGYVAAGALHPYFVLTAARAAPTTLQQLQRESPDAVVLDSFPRVTTYARAGSNDTSAHAVGLGDLQLVCPRFHQYSIEPREVLDLTAACLPRAGAIIVDDTVRPEAGRPEWNAYVARVRALVATGYDCVRASVSQVCVRRVG